MRILVTGASGFIGRALADQLVQNGHRVVGAVRRASSLPEGVERLTVPDLRGPWDWRGALEGIDAVAHLAGRVHILRNAFNQPLSLFRCVNAAATRRLATAAAEQGVGRFLLVSTIKVNGERTPLGPFTEADPPSPAEPYAHSKYEAEQAILDRNGMAPVILRPPLVYGPGVRANFRRLIELCDGGWPLPFGGVTAKRSIIGVRNLVSAIERCLVAPEAAGKLYLVRDRDDVTIGELTRAIAEALDRPSRQLAVPPRLLRALGSATGQREVIDRLVEPLQVDDSAIRRDLDWTPPFSLAEELAPTIVSYRSSLRHQRPTASEVVPAAESAIPAPISAVVVTYHTGAVLRESLPRLLDESRVGELIVVDNGNDAASTAFLDRLGERDARVRVVRGHGNVGFAAGCNIGASYASLPFLLLLNPDCVIEPGTVDRLLAVEAESKDDWIATPRLIDAQGHEQRGGRRNHATPLNCLIEGTRLDWLLPGQPFYDRVNLHRRPLPPGPIAVPSISGAFMLMPTRTFDRLGGMDERYFLHFEDLDFCLRLARLGGRATFVPDLTAKHYCGTSAVCPLTVARHKMVGLRRYFFTHFAGTYPRPALFGIWTLVAAGILAKGCWRWLWESADRGAPTPPATPSRHSMDPASG